MSILFAGTPENAAVTLRELAHAGIPISLVLTRPDAPVGRKKVLTPSPVALVAEELGIPVLKSARVAEEELRKIGERQIQLALVVAFGVLLKEQALKALPLGWFNLHYSLLPQFRGAAPVQRALMEGVTETGVTLFKIDQGLDTGDVLASVPTRIEPVENAGALLERLTGLGVSLLLEQLPRISSGLLSLKPQEEIGASLAPKISRTEAEMSFNNAAKKLENLTRGCNPEPGAWTQSNQGYDLKIHVAWASNISHVAVGHVSTDEGRVFVGCAGSALELIEVQPAGKSRMSAADWVRGTSAPVVLGSVE